MVEKTPVAKKKMTADWLLRGSLTKIGDTFDRLTGRRWVPSSSLATSELIERMKKLLDAEAKQVPGKGTVVPHHIKLKMQWDKFSTDAEEALATLEYELLTAAVDHINDSLYYTYAPVSLEVKPDYFTQGVKLFVGFDKFTDDDRDVEMNVTVPEMKLAHLIPDSALRSAGPVGVYIARFGTKGVSKEKRLEFPAGGRLSVGRTGENALVLDDASVSKIHASLAVDAEGRLSIADTGSTNGTFINDQRISYGKSMLLETDDEVRFGVVPVSFEYVPSTIEPEADETTDEQTVAIDGFEFTKRVSEVDPKGSAQAIPMPGDAVPVPETARAVMPEPVGEPGVNTEQDPVATDGESQDGEIKTEIKENG